MDKYFNPIEHAVDGIVILQDGVFKLVNRALVRMSGYDKEELLGMPFVKLVAPEYRNSVIAKNRDRLAGKEVPSIYEAKVITKGGEVRDIEINASSTDYEGRAADEVIIRDITERKRAEERLLKRTHDLGKRVKELRCLYGTSKLMAEPDKSLDEVFQEIVHLIPPSWQYPNITCARITFAGQEFKTDNFDETEWKQSADIRAFREKVGAVEVYSLQEKSAVPEEPFLKEEGNLIDALAREMGKFVERKRAEEALRESEEKLYRTFESINDGIAVADLTGVIVEANDRMVEMHGLGSKNELLGKKAIDWIARHDRQKAMMNMQKVIAQGSIENIEHTLLNADGSEFPCELSASVLNGAAGNPVGLVTIVRDITKRKKREEALRLQDEIAANMSEGVCLIGLNDAVIRYANPKFEEMFGYEPGEMVGKHVSIVNAPIDKPPEETAEEIMETLHRRGEWHGEVNNIKKDGTPFWCYANVSVFNHHEYGKVLVAVHIDITERKKAEEALRESEEKLRRTFESVSDGIGVTDLTGVIVEANDRIVEMHGLASSQ
jgi:PAS domain S-box-containing protein